MVEEPQKTKRKSAEAAKIDELSKEYAKTKYNKATDKYLGILRAKIARLKKAMSEGRKQKGSGYAVKKVGDATVAIVGPPNVGKSSLIAGITNAESKVADYAFTTLDVIPGMLLHNGAQIQLLDLPGLIEGMHIGRGAGRKVASVIRVSDLVMFVVDNATYKVLPRMIEELEDLGIMVNKRMKKISVEQMPGGGVVVEYNSKIAPGKAEIKEVLGSMGIYNAKVTFFEDATAEDLVDVISNSNVYIRGIAVLNKIDKMTSDEISSAKEEIKKTTGMEPICISVADRSNLGALKDAIFSALKIIRIFLKPKDALPDTDKPVIVKEGSTVIDVAKKVNERKAQELRFAYVQGKSVKFETRVGKDHVLADGDIVTFVY
ncbi:MAG: GTPase [Candidatus Micrarchaeia archaeon]